MTSDDKFRYKRIGLTELGRKVAKAMSEKKVKVIRPADPSKDYELPESEAAKLFEEGKLQYDNEKECYVDNSIPWTMT